MGIGLSFSLSHFENLEQHSLTGLAPSSFLLWRLAWIVIRMIGLYFLVGF